MSLYRLALGCGLVLLVIVAAVAGAEGWRDEGRADRDRVDRVDNFEAERDRLAAAALLSTMAARPTTPPRHRGLDVSPSTTPPADAPQMDEGLEAAATTGTGTNLHTGNMVEGADGNVRPASRYSEGRDPYPVHPACGSTWACFFWGYRDGGGQYPEERIDAMINCESGWQIDPGNEWGLAQFNPGTWGIVSGITGLIDWRDPYAQGYNVAVWASMVSPGTTAGWPYCWWVWGG